MQPSRVFLGGVLPECTWNATLSCFLGGKACRNALGMQPSRVFWGGACRNALGMQPSLVFSGGEGLAGMHLECNPLSCFLGGGLAGMHWECKPLVFSGRGLAGMHLECNPLVFSGGGLAGMHLECNPFVFSGAGLAGMHLECNPLVFCGGACRNALGMQPSRVFWGGGLPECTWNATLSCFLRGGGLAGMHLECNPLVFSGGGLAGMHLECTWNAVGMEPFQLFVWWVYWNGVGMQLDYAGHLFWRLGCKAFRAGLGS